MQLCYRSQLKPAYKTMGKVRMSEDEGVLHAGFDPGK